MKKQIIIIAFFIFTVTGGYLFYSHKQAPGTLQEYFGEPEYKSVDPDRPFDKQTSIVQIGERIFKIPTVYIQTDLRGRREQDGLNLLYVLPDFTSRADFKNRREYYEARDARQMAHMLIQDVSKVTPIKIIMENRKKNEQLTKYDGIHYGLEKYIDFDSPKHLNIRYDDIYLEKTEEDIKSYIECAPDTEAKFPGCSHIFNDKNLRYDIYYNKQKYLADWQEQRQKAIAFIDSFEIKSTQSKSREN